MIAFLTRTLVFVAKLLQVQANANSPGSRAAPVAVKNKLEGQNEANSAGTNVSVV